MTMDRTNKEFRKPGSLGGGIKDTKCSRTLQFCPDAFQRECFLANGSKHPKVVAVMYDSDRRKPQPYRNVSAI
ncbi:hypothetical protein VTI74DRAFT_3593 [Chaetomium olivicolor]